MTTHPIPETPTAGKGPDGHPKPDDAARRSAPPGGGGRGIAGLHSAIAWLLLAALLALRPVMADEIPATDSRPPATWSQRLDRIEQELNRGVADSARIDSLWEDLVATRTDALNQSQELDSKNKETRRLIAALGPKPAEGEPAETPDVQAQRRLFDEELANQESLLKQANLALERADELARTLGAARRSRLSRDLLSPLPYPLQTQTWDRAWDQIQNFDSELHRGGKLLQSGWLTMAAIGGLLLGFMLSTKISSAATHGMLRRFGQCRGALAPSYRERIRAAIVVALLRGLFPAVLFVGWLTGLWTLFERYHLLSDLTIKPVGIGFGIIFYVLFSALVRAVLRPSTPAWRIMPVAPGQSRILTRRLELLVGVLALEIPFLRMMNLAGRPDDVLSVHTFILSSVLCVVFALLLPDSLWKWRPEQPESASGNRDTATGFDRGLWFWRLARWFTMAVFVVAWVSSLAGYGHVAAFLMRGILRMLLLAVILLAIRGVMRETLTFLLTGHETRPREGFGVLNFWLLALSDVLLMGFAAFGVLLSWDAPWVLLRALIGGTLGGFSVGAYRIAPADIVLGIVVFSAMVLLTRFLQRELEECLLPQTRLDIGSRTAISAGVGYLGIGLALVTGVSIIGIDLSQMALIAGALSVGIGFGLQNVVNNFISGAILLAEQPIKIGDWIVVGNIEGNVRRINIRATEIETFNRASVIVPNADLLQTSVTNWTYKNRKGRVDIAVGVAYGSYPEEVEQILLECARANDNVIRWPEAYVLLQEFGDSSLNFELRVFVSDIEKRHLIASDLRKAIMRSFRARDIEIPFPRRDLWVHHEDGTTAVSNRHLDESELFDD